MAWDGCFRAPRPWTRSCAATSSSARPTAGLRSLFVGFETLAPGNLVESNKRQNLGRDYAAVAKRLHDLGIMINGSFVFGMDDDDETVFERTVEWGIEHGLTTATYHIQTPYPGTRLFARMEADGPHPTRDWDLYDTRHVVYRPARLSPEALKPDTTAPIATSTAGRRSRAASLSHDSVKHQAKHFFYAAGWKKFEPLWDMVIRAKRLAMMTPLLEGVLSKVTSMQLPMPTSTQRADSLPLPTPQRVGGRVGPGSGWALAVGSWELLPTADGSPDRRRRKSAGPPS